MKKNIFIVLVLIAVPMISFGASYQLLEPLGSGQQSITDPIEYIRQIYWYILGLTIALSVLMMVVGGVEYTLIWASESKKSEAKKRITDAIIGLIIGLGSYLILYTINPQLVSLELEEAGICNSNSGGGQGAASTVVPGNSNGGGF